MFWGTCVGGGKSGLEKRMVYARMLQSVHSASVAEHLDAHLVLIWIAQLNRLVVCLCICIIVNEDVCLHLIQLIGCHILVACNYSWMGWGGTVSQSAWFLIFVMVLFSCYKLFLIKVSPF